MPDRVTAAELVRRRAGDKVRCLVLTSGVASGTLKGGPCELLLRPDERRVGLLGGLRVCWPCELGELGISSILAHSLNPSLAQPRTLAASTIETISKHLTAASNFFLTASCDVSFTGWLWEESPPSSPATETDDCQATLSPFSVKSELSKNNCCG